MRRLFLPLILALATAGAAAKDSGERWERAIEKAREFFEQGQYQPAEQELVHALELSETFGAADPRAIVVLNDLASVQHALGNVADAERLYRHALAACKHAGKARRHCVIRLSINLASLYADTGQYAHVERLARQVLPMLDPDNDAADVACLHLYLATVAFHRSEFEEAEDLFESSLALWEKVTAQDSPEKATLLNNIASVRLKAGRPDDAIPLLERAIIMLEATCGADHPHLIRPLANLAVSQALIGHATEARVRADRARAIAENALGPNHVITGETLVQCALVLRRGARKGEAKALGKRGRSVIAKYESDNLLGHTVDFRAYRPPSAVLGGPSSHQAP